MSNEVSWKNVFYGLLAFAINSMTQHAGNVCGAPAHIDFLLRSSPVVNMLDALYILKQLAYQTYCLGNIKSARDQVRLLRFQRPSMGVRQKTSLNKWKKRALFRWIFFLMNFPGLLKLYVSSGLIWSKLIGSMYLFSWIIVEYLTYPCIPSRTQTNPDNTPNSSIDSSTTSYPDPNASIKPRSDINVEGVKRLEFVVIAMGVLADLWALSYAFQAMFQDKLHVHFSHYQWLAIVTAVFGTMAFLVGCAARLRLDTTPTRNYTSGRRGKDLFKVFLFILTIMLLSVVYWFMGDVPGLVNLSELQIKILIAVFAGVWVLVAVQVASTATNGIRDGGPDAERKMEWYLGWYFFFLNFVAGFTYLMFCYDPAGTYKPDWVADEWLGRLV